MSHSPLALAADSSQFTSGSAGLSSQSSMPTSHPDIHTDNTQHPPASSPSESELAVILRPFLLG